VSFLTERFYFTIGVRQIAQVSPVDPIWASLTERRVIAMRWKGKCNSHKQKTKGAYARRKRAGSVSHSPNGSL